MAVITREELWRADKELLKLSGLKVSIDWEGKKPSHDDVLAVLAVAYQALESAQDIPTLDEGVARETLERILGEVSKIWSFDIQAPALEVVENKGYLKRATELQIEVRNNLPWYKVSSCPRDAYFFSHRGLLLVPQRYPLVTEDHGQLEMTPVPWSKPHFERTLAGCLSYAAFRQARGEWGEDCFRNIKQMNQTHQISSAYLGDLLKQYVTELVVHNGHHEMAIYAAMDKVSLWEEGELIDVYRAVATLASRADLKKMALLDVISPREVVEEDGQGGELAEIMTEIDSTDPRRTEKIRQLGKFDWITREA